MKTRQIDTRAAKLIVGAMILAITTGALVKLGSGGGDCNLLHGAAWFVLQLVHPIIGVGLRSVSTYFHGSMGLLQHLPHIVAFAAPLLCFVAG